MHEQMMIDETLEREKRILVETEESRRQLMSEVIVNRSLESEISLCREIQNGVFKSVFTVERLQGLDFQFDQRLQRISGFEEEPVSKKLFTNGLIDVVFNVEDDGTAKFLFIKESIMNEMSIDLLYREGFRLRQDIADSYAELHEGWETIFECGDVFSRFYRRPNERFMYVGPYLHSEVERQKYERFVQAANLMESECPPEGTVIESLKNYVWILEDNVLQLANQKNAIIYTVLEEPPKLRIRKGFWVLRAWGYLMAKEPVDIGDGFLVHSPEVCTLDRK
ncbi:MULTISPECIES: hypothetical protein [unclassified Paenibacillus]|uniref:hypothetical protein n=1 Tax=unclassified Paenibacillus TaxID=185978 RepID=UPI002788074E|nr:MULTISPECIES: hypothetical protein [unclassified Paenibacillus]MDQ0896398.1 hypothetical protein [Paenibacillus sp. V4I7]MDQ0914058.1 hypothetical protein [Paenibacillus sp. V4I5]